MDLYDKFKPRRTPIRMLTQAEGPLSHPLYEIAEKYFLFPRLEGPLANRMYFNGKPCIVWSINNYLGLGNDEYLRSKEMEAIKTWSIGYPMGARMFSGDTGIQHELESELSDFIGKEATLLLNYGYQGMVSLIDTLTDSKDIIIYDAECHACIIDGIRLHRGKHFNFRHNDVESLRKKLERAEKMTEQSGGAILVITEGVFSMNGNQGRLKEIIDLKQKFTFRLLVDDAHGFGTMGATGGGTGQEQGVQEGIDFYFATFAKAMASIGAFVSSDKPAIDFIRFGIRSQMFSKALPMLYVAGNLERLRYARQHPELLARLRSNAGKLRSGLLKLGFNLGPSNSQIVPVYLSSSIDESANLVIDLRENYSVFCSGAMYPVVPKGVLLLRLVPTAAHTEEDITETLAAFAAVKGKLATGFYDQPLDAKTLASVTAYSRCSAYSTSGDAGLFS